MVADLSKEIKPPLLSHTLADRATSTQSWLCVGLDPEIEKMPRGVPRNASGIERFCLGIIASTHPFVVGYKINFGFFEALGPYGWRVLERVRAAIPSGLIAIADAKRGDIGNTSRAYAQSIFDGFQFDAATVSPYLGWDALEPFLDRYGTLIYVLCKTSNPGSDVYQNRLSDGVPLYMQVARDAAACTSNAEIGLVVGATQIEPLSQVREEFPSIQLLVPGVGAQGANPADIMPVVRRNAVVPVSRQLIYASSDPDFEQAAGAAAERLAQLCWTDDAL